MPIHVLLSVSRVKRPWSILTLPTCHVLISVYCHKRPFAFLTFPTYNGLIFIYRQIGTGAILIPNISLPHLYTEIKLYGQFSTCHGLISVFRHKRPWTIHGLILVYWHKRPLQCSKLSFCYVCSYWLELPK